MKMVRTRIQLTEEQAQALKALAARDGVSMAALVRLGVDCVIGGTEDAERRRRALEAIGRFSSAHHDVARRHDAYLDEAYGSWRSS